MKKTIFITFLLINISLMHSCNEEGESNTRGKNSTSMEEMKIDKVLAEIKKDLLKSDSIKLVDFSDKKGFVPENNFIQIDNIMEKITHKVARYIYQDITIKATDPVTTNYALDGIKKYIGSVSPTLPQYTNYADKIKYFGMGPLLRWYNNNEKFGINIYPIKDTSGEFTYVLEKCKNDRVVDSNNGGNPDKVSEALFNFGDVGKDYNSEIFPLRKHVIK